MQLCGTLGNLHGSHKERSPRRYKKDERGKKSHHTTVKTTKLKRATGDDGTGDPHIRNQCPKSESWILSISGYFIKRYIVTGCLRKDILLLAVQGDSSMLPTKNGEDYFLQGVTKRAEITILYQAELKLKTIIRQEEEDHQR